MKILHITPVYWPATEWGGPVRSVAALARGQRELGHDVTVVTTNARATPGLPKHPPGEFQVAGQDVVYHPVWLSDRFGLSPRMAADLWRRVPDNEIAHVHGLWTFSTAAASRICGIRKVPYVLSPRGALLEWAISQKYAKKKVYRYLVEDWTVRHAAKLHYTADKEKQGGPGRYQALPSVIAPNPIDLDDLLAVPEPDGARTGFRLLICGRIHKTKGFDLLVPALARARGAGFDIPVRVVGNDEGGYRGVVESMAREHGVDDLLTFAGNLDQDELVCEYAEASGLVMPSYQENFGMSAAEALSAARPVIVSTGVSIAGEIENAGAGIVTELDSSAVAAAMIRFAEDPELRVRMGKNGRKFAKEHYSRQAVAGILIDAYRQILAD